MNPSRPIQPVKVGVIGLGRFGRLHSLTLAGLAEAELVGVVARRHASLDNLRRELPDVRGWLDLDQAIPESGAEAWIVACSTADHVRVATKLLHAGQKVLLEKPISESGGKGLRAAARVGCSDAMSGTPDVRPTMRREMPPRLSP